MESKSLAFRHLVYLIPKKVFDRIRIRLDKCIKSLKKRKFNLTINYIKRDNTKLANLGTLGKR